MPAVVVVLGALLVGFNCNGTPRATLSVTVVGEGRVEIAPIGAVCPADCIHELSAADDVFEMMDPPTVTLMAIPARGWWFVRWEDASPEGTGLAHPCFPEGVNGTPSQPIHGLFDRTDSDYECQALFVGGGFVLDDVPFGAAEGGDPSADVTFVQGGTSPGGAVWVVIDTAGPRPPPVVLHSHYLTVHYHDAGGATLAEVTTQVHAGAPGRFFTGVNEADVTIVEDARGAQIVLAAPPAGVTQLGVETGVMITPTSTRQQHFVPNDGTRVPLIVAPIEIPPR
jgi:hypothetical protein